jgi:phosphatidate cytidylyltransferase
VKRVLTAVILIPIVVLALFRAPLWLFALLVLGVALLAAREYFDIAEKTGFRPMRGLAFASLVLSFGISYVAAFAVAQLSSIARQQNVSVAVDLHAIATGSDLWALCAIAILIFTGLIFLIAGLRREPLTSALPDAAVSYLMLPYIGFTLGLLPILRSGENGALFLVYLMMLVWCGDIAAYYVGRAIGRHKLVPRVSPGKTWEGAIASVLAAIVIAFILFREIIPISQALEACHVIPRVKFNPSLIITFDMQSPAARPDTVPIWFAGLFGLCVNIAAQMGDLVESALKRGAGMKDSGNLLPGHGGVLDRIDALLFALPVGLLFYVAGMSRYFSSPPYTP